MQAVIQIMTLVSSLRTPPFNIRNSHSNGLDFGGNVTHWRPEGSSKNGDVIALGAHTELVQ